MANETPPQEGSRPVDGQAQTHGAVDDDKPTESAHRYPDISAVASNDQPAVEQDASSDNGHKQDDDFRSQDRGPFEPFTRAERLALFGLGATVVAAVATIWLAWSTDDMARSTRQLADLAREQARDTKNAITAANRQAAAAERANDLAETPQISVSVQLPFSTPTANVKLNGTYQVSNTGRLPIESLKLQAALVIVTPPNIPNGVQLCKSCGSNILFPTQGFAGNGLSVTTSLEAERMTQEFVDMIKSEKISLYLQGRVDYIDRDKTHVVKMCQQYNPKENNLTPCPFGNTFD